MRSCISAASTRAGTSDSPPGANGTTKVTGRLGYVCVRADGAASTTARSVTKNSPSRGRGRRGSAYVVMYPSRGRAQLSTVPQAHRVPQKVSCRFAAAEVEGHCEVDPRRNDAIVDQHMFPHRVHGAAARVGMHSSAGSECNARHAIGREMDGVGAGAANDRSRLFPHDRRLRRAERLDDRQIFVELDRRIADIDMQRGFGGAGAVGEGAQDTPQAALDAVDGLAGHGPNIEIKAAG